MNEIQKMKQRFGIIGNSPGLHRAIDIAMQVAPTDLSVLITGESGTGKEIFPQIVHQLSHRKHGNYIAVNCGAIPEGTIDSELFGHEKGAFTGAHDSRKGYFEVADKGTIFLDEVADLPLSTQVRLLRVLETGEFMRVGSSKVLKTNVRVIAATNINVLKAIYEDRFREDLYYRLNTVPISMPPLRDRKEDILLLFRKFSTDFAEKYRMPTVQLTEDAQLLMNNYRWPGNIRQLKNITEQISIIEEHRMINAEKVKQYLPEYDVEKYPAVFKTVDEKTFASEREILYKILFDMKNDMNDLKKIVRQLLQKGTEISFHKDTDGLLSKLYRETDDEDFHDSFDRSEIEIKNIDTEQTINIQDTEEIIEETLSITMKEVELIKKALNKCKGKRKIAAQELGISERTLYRKIKEYDIK